MERMRSCFSRNTVDYLYQFIFVGTAKDIDFKNIFNGFVITRFIPECSLLFITSFKCVESTYIFYSQNAVDISPEQAKRIFRTCDQVRDTTLEK